MEGIGRVRVGGLKAFGNTDGSTRARLVCRLQGPIDAVETRYVGGREVTVEINGDISSPPWARSGGSWAKWLDKRGDGTETAWSELISLFPTLWTTDHKVRGIAQSVLLWFNPGLEKPKYLSLYQTGVPETEEVVRASLMFDPRDGTQSGVDRSTWKWSDNGILACAHVLRRDPAFTFEHFDWSLISAEANRADAMVATLTGMEKRARAWGIWSWESGRAETMQQLLDSIGTEIRLTDEGKIWFQLIDDAFASEIDFTPADGYDILWRSGPEAVERPNIARVKYYSPERNYDLTELALSSYNDDDTVITGVAWAYVQEEVDRYGPKYLDIELPFCPSASQAQRIARRKFALARGDTGSITTNMVGLSAWGLLYGTVQLPDLGDVLNTRFEPPRCDDDNGSVEIPFTVWPALPPWNPATDEAPAPDPIPELGYETGMITPNPPTGALQITYPDGGKELRVSFSLPAQDFDTVETVFRTYTGALPNAWQGMAEYPAPPATNLAYAGGDYAGSTIDTRLRVFDDDDGTYFSDPLHTVVGTDNTACAQPTVISVDIEPGISGSGAQPATIDITLTASEVRAAAIRLQRNTGAGFATILQTNIRPGQQVSFSDSSGASGAWRFQTITSDGTAGVAKDYDIVINHSGS
ncbi:hypothetical protein PH562_18935 [Rhizobium sp. CNPSo 4062]|uniref:hypothetical protein n=1 Tax=Rhizobium sp. CNPSo 4062 TaxID=3021410 RepID=UPI00254B1F48|nr:hypothetical protein [Rhizobium sp. CNPSo 4062]MDK4704336.1 hypothetical protein [Rhizobium sp. CNPSo 4062]